MKFLFFAALVALAAADYHDDTFHFSSRGQVSGLQKGAFIQSSTPLLTKKVSTFTQQPAFTKQYTTVQSTPAVYSSVVAQPAYTQRLVAPVLVKSIEEEIPVYSQQYAVKQIAQPAVFAQKYTAQIAQPVYSQQYAVKQFTQPAVFSQKFDVKPVAQPVYSQQYSVKQVAQPVYSQYSAVVKPVVAEQQYSSLSGVSTYASAYQGPQFRILSQVQEADPAGPYKLAYSTENGIQASEEGSLIAGTEGDVVAAQGSYSYTGPDGVVYTVNYIADENGFRAVGDHLPTPPPVPAEILRSLEENAASGEQYDEEGKLLKK
ncbi:Endocuticle structural glycoprotein SgAbd-2 [Frankliniella fusca]|uniref:Endocuticle structural glycoprotein SgAbd-2 n=1 Tax=Frankliniella fusca TaxID=407009 RepID=A0AAE1LSY0_9NEOP|nr:Endocuticle structural glycoprotein SgAbd-2 [Frankliniella fusca]